MMAKIVAKNGAIPIIGIVRDTPIRLSEVMLSVLPKPGPNNPDKRNTSAAGAKNDSIFPSAALMPRNMNVAVTKEIKVAWLCDV